jgi:hypothetical protein
MNRPCRATNLAQRASAGGFLLREAQRRYRIEAGRVQRPFLE